MPELTGDYETLVGRAVRMEAHGLEVWVVHVDELLAALTMPGARRICPECDSSGRSNAN